MRIIYLVLTIVLFVSIKCYPQFNKRYNWHLKYKEIDYRVCTDMNPKFTDVKVDICFILEADVNNIFHLDQEWIFPRPLTDLEGNKIWIARSAIDKRANEISCSTYQMQENNELVKGKWKYRLRNKGELLVEKEFWVE